MLVIEETEIFSRWLNSLNDFTTRARIGARLFRLEKDGHFGDIKSLGEGVFEMRFTFGGGCRIYYTYRSSRIVLLLAGGDKSTQLRDIRLAKALAKDIL